MAVIDYSSHHHTFNEASTRTTAGTADASESFAMRILRPVAHLLVPTFLGITATVALFYLMQALIASSGPALTKDKGMHMVDFVRTPHLTEVQTKQLHPRKPPPPEPAPEVKTEMNFNVKVDKAGWGMQPVKIDSQANLSGAFSFASDGNYLPIVKVAPTYPTAAEIRGLEGWVVLQFTVDELGRVINPEVVENCAHVTNRDGNDECEDMPNSIFDRAALNAAVKFRYKPKVVDGVAVAVPHVRNKITFVLSENE